MKQVQNRSFVATTLFCLLSGAAPGLADPMDLQVFSNFELFNTDVGEEFSIGLGQAVATFSGDAFAGRIGVGSLYRSGIRAWMVNPGGVGEVQFETNAAEVEFFARANQFASGDTVIRALDDSGRTIGSSFTLPPGQGFTLVSFTGNIDRIRIENQAMNGNLGINGIDDFGFTPIMPLEGDYNNDGVVTIADYVVWRDNLGAPAGTLPNDGDGGTIDVDQYNTWKSNFGMRQQPAVLATALPIPEPTGLLLLSLGAAVTIACMRERRG